MTLRDMSSTELRIMVKSVVRTRHSIDWGLERQGDLLPFYVKPFSLFP
jgi:hypothetical protein